ncbi:unnamed protein product, partial [Acanthoscelides obtectus]
GLYRLLDEAGAGYSGFLERNWGLGITIFSAEKEKANMAKRGNYGTWSADDMEKVLTAYNNGEKGVNECSRDYGIYGKYKINATTIFNVDESCFSTVAKKCQKIVARKGSKPVRSIASGEWGVNTTIVCCLAGFYVPPLIIFKRKGYTAELSNGAPLGSKIEISDSGYITSELFVKWLQHFMDSVRPTKENKVLLILDGHTTHCKNLAALLLARENGVVLLQLPGHTTHRLQPLDKAFFKPLETNYTQASERWFRSNPERAVTQYQVAELLNAAYGKAATIETAINALRSSGVWPVNRHVFNYSHFVASEVLRPSVNPTSEASRLGN